MAGSRRRAQYAISPSVKMRRMKRSPYRAIVAAMRGMSVASRPRPMMVDMLLPQPSDGFEWVQASAGPALRANPLQPLSTHVFTTRAWRLGSPAADPDDQ